MGSWEGAPGYSRDSSFTLLQHVLQHPEGGNLPGMRIADCKVNAFSTAYINGHTIHSLAYTRRSNSENEGVSWQVELKNVAAGTSIGAVQSFLHIQGPGGRVFRAALVFVYKEHPLSWWAGGDDDAAIDADSTLSPQQRTWLKSELRVVLALPVVTSDTGEPCLAGSGQSGDKCYLKIVPAHYIIRRRLVPRVTQAAWMPAQWVNCHPVPPGRV
jgi:hypothetical protein